MEQLVTLIVGGIYILIFGFFLLLIVRAYQALTIYVIKNSNYLPSGFFIRRRDINNNHLSQNDLNEEAEEANEKTNKANSETE